MSRDVKTSRNPEVFLALERMRVLDKDLFAVAADLNARLSTVLLPEGPSTASADCPVAVPEVYRVSEHIHEHCRDAERLLSKLREIVDRLEV